MKKSFEKSEINSDRTESEYNELMIGLGQSILDNQTQKTNYEKRIRSLELSSESKMKIIDLMYKENSDLQLEIDKGKRFEDSMEKYLEIKEREIGKIRKDNKSLRVVLIIVSITLLVTSIFYHA